MDEIELMKKFKKFSKYVFIFDILCATIFLLTTLINYIINREIKMIGILRLIFMIAIGLNTLFILFSLAYLIYKLMYIKTNISFDKEYIRELYKSYPPAIVSYIYDLNTEVYRDYTATILYLFTKKYINISKFNEEVKITEGENKDISNLISHEKYVYDCVINKKEFNENKLTQFIMEDLIEKKLIEKVKAKDSKMGKIYNIIGIFIILISLLSISATRGVSMMIGVVFGLIIISLKSIEMDKYRLLSKGKQELKKIKAFKNFIKDYTLIEEKDIEYIQILEEYIPYSLALGASPQVEEYIKQNEIYRNLIYKGRENWI